MSREGDQDAPSPRDCELERLRSSEASLNAVLEAAVDAVLTTNDHGVISSVNASAVRLFGYAREEMVGNNVKMLMPEPYHSLHDGFLERYRATGERKVIGVGRVVEGRRRDGSTFPLDLAVSEVRLPDGTRSFAGIARDVSDRRAAENALRVSEERFRDLFENASDLIMSVNAAGVVLLANRAWRTALGFPPDRVAGTRIEDIIAPDFHDECLPAFRRDATDSGTRTIRAQLRARDGRTVFVDGTVWCRIRGDRVVSTWTILRDVTREVELERTKRDFVSVVSHELRTPLTSIRGALGLIVGGVAGPLSARADELIRIAAKSSDRLTRLVNDILDLDKLQAARLDLNLERVNLARIVRAVAVSVEIVARARDVSIAQQIEPQLELLADPDRIEQVLLNLVANAIKFSPTGAVVSVRAASLGDAVKVSVEDRGPGIKPADLPRLFLEFQQLEAPDRRRHGGTGLGLAISKAIVEAHHGEVGVDSTVGKGSTFWFTLPCCEQPPQTVLRHALVACGDDEFRRKIASACVSARLSVEEAATEAQAFRHVELRHFDVIVVDQNLKQGDGWSVIRAVRANGCTAHIVAMSDFAKPNSETYDRLRELDVVALLAKPVPASAVAERVAAALDGTIGSPAVVPSTSALADRLSAMQARFRRTLVGRLDEIEDALRQAERDGTAAPSFREAMRAAHKLRGTAGTYGFAHVGAHVASIEEQLESMLLANGTDFAQVWISLRLARQAAAETD